MSIVMRLFLTVFASLLAAVCYLPFVASPLVFDDQVVFGAQFLYDYAQIPFSAEPRTFPYFSLGLIQILSDGDLAWNRYLNIVIHGLSVVALSRLLSRCVGNSDECKISARCDWIVGFVCLWFAINPVAVYGVGYLAQRTILFATLFGLVSASLYLRAQQSQRSADVLSAALFAALSMFSKEHAILLPAAVVALTPLVASWSLMTIVRALSYLMLSVPCAIWVFMHRGASYVGTNYEIYSGEILSQISAADGMASSPWLLSVATQMLLFWRYLFLWLVPNPQWMSADMRVDFSMLWTSGWAYVGVASSLAVFIAIAVLWWSPGTVLSKRRWAAAFAFAAIPFVVELSVVKVQEPFVLYRSYLWMPAYALLFAKGLLTADEVLACYRSVMPRRLFWSVLALALIALFPCAQDRLRSFSSEETLWLDAKEKLPRGDVAGADRIYYNLAGEAYKRKDFDEALHLSEKVVVQNPSAFQGYLAVGTSLLAKGDVVGALASFDAATAHNPPVKFLGYIEFKRCLVNEFRGEREAMIECWKRSARMGYEGAKFRLNLAGIEE